jgi:hypothetical protein
MQPRPISRSTLTRRRIGALACACAAAAAVALVPVAGASAHRQATAKLKLPAERTSATGNFFTLEAYVAPTSSKPVANFEMKVCTSAHTPADTAIDPAFFTLSVTQGGTLAESVGLAKSPPIVLKPLKPLQCDEGWLGFSVPKGKTVLKLEYEYKSTIAWAVG